MNDKPLRFHLSLKASRKNFDAMVGFYETLFGVAPAKRKPGYVKFEVAEPALNFTLNQVEHVELDEVDHLGIQVWSDDSLGAARARVRAAGLEVAADEDDVECCYAGQNKFWVVDPDGRNIEFFHVLRDVEQHGKRLAAASPCCAPAKGQTGAAAGCCG